MSPLGCRRLLWLVFVLVAPVLLVSPLQARVPAARILMLGGISFLEMSFESTRGAAVALTLLLVAQGLIAAGVLWFAAYLTSSALAGLPARARTITTVAIAVALVVVASSVELYRDPFRADTINASLLDVYE